MENKLDNMDEMRIQFEKLSKKLNEQQILNEELMQTVLSTKMGWINRLIHQELYIAIPVVMTCFAGLYWMGYVSLALAVCTVLLCLMDVYADFKINKVIGKGWIEKDLVSSRLTLVKMKKARFIQLLLTVPVLGIWAVFWLLEMLSHNTLFFYATIVGLLTGMVATLFIYRKMQKVNDEAIKQINQFVNGES